MDPGMPPQRPISSLMGLPFGNYWDPYFNHPTSWAHFNIPTTHYPSNAVPTYFTPFHYTNPNQTPYHPSRNVTRPFQQRPFLGPRRFNTFGDRVSPSSRYTNKNDTVNVKNLILDFTNSAW